MSTLSEDVTLLTEKFQRVDYATSLDNTQSQISMMQRRYSTLEAKLQTLHADFKPGEFESPNNHDFRSTMAGS